MEMTTIADQSMDIFLTNSSDIFIPRWRNRTGMFYLDRKYPLSWFTYASPVITVVLVVLGLFGNTVTIILMRNMPFRANAHGMYLTALATADISSLLVAPIRKRFVMELFGRDLRALTLTGCRMYTYAYRTTKICSSSFVVLICVERFIALWFPVKAKILSTRRMGFIIVCFIYFAVYAISVMFALHACVRNGRCLHDTTAENDVFSQISANTAWALSTLIPTGLLLCLTPLTLFKLCHQHSIRNRIGGQNRTSHTNYVTAMLMSAFLAYFCLITTFSVVFQIFKLQGISLPRLTAPWAVALIETMQISEQTNYAINFFLYGLYNSEFRRQFISLFACLCFRRQPYETHINESSSQSETVTTGKAETSLSKNLQDKY